MAGEKQQVPPLRMPFPSGGACSGRSDRPFCSLREWEVRSELQVLNAGEERWLGLLGFAFQGALEGLIEGGFGFLVFRLGDLALSAFDFELEEFFF